MSIVSIRRLVLALCWVGFAGAAGSGCAGASGSTGLEAPTSLPTAQRLYSIGEERFAAGRADQAVELWRHAILQLPTSSDYDELRHRLILRRAHGQLVANAQTSDRAYLEDGRQMLERYLARHEALFGEGKKAKAQRGEVYEILYEFESRLDGPAALPEPEDEVAFKSASAPVVESKAREPVAKELTEEQEQARNDANLATVGIYDSRVVQSAGVAATSQPQRPGLRSPTTKFGPSRPWRDGEIRQVHVDTRNRPSVDDNGTRDSLRSWSTEPAPWLTLPMVQEFLPPRPYVRVGGIARRVEGDRARLGGHGLAMSVVRKVRPQLRSCYDEAFARRAEAVVVATVEFDVRPDGTIARPNIVAGEVVDPIGDACVLDQLALAQVEVDPNRPTTRLRVPLTFFYDGAVYMDESGGRAITSSIQTGLPATESIPSAPQGCGLTGSCRDPVPQKTR